MFSTAVKILSNYPGWRTNRKIVVFESDDWGSERMPSMKVFDALSRHGINLGNKKNERYNKYDSLASADDLDALFTVLNSIKDRNGTHPSFTALSLVANPDFDKIAESNFSVYEYELFTETLARKGQEDAINYWQEGYKEKLFIPQFHGREHLNVASWLRALSEGHEETKTAFDYRFWGITNSDKKINYQAAFDLEFAKDIFVQKSIVEDGLNLFKKIHGFSATYFVAPNGPRNYQLNDVLAGNGIKYINTAKRQQEVLGDGTTKTHYHKMGQKSNEGLTFLTRNATFEPSLQKEQAIDACLKDIAIAYRVGKPATISTHRVNYIGVLSKENREKGLSLLEQLLLAILKEWPNVEFMNTLELGDLIINDA